MEMKNYLLIFNYIRQQFRYGGREGDRDKREDLKFGDGYFPSRTVGKTVKKWSRGKYERKSGE
jgi:hypothetical protein